MRQQLLELGYQAGIVAVQQMRNNGIPFSKIQKQLFPDERVCMNSVSQFYQPKCHGTMRTLTRWYMRGFERGAGEYIWENRRE